MRKVIYSMMVSLDGFVEGPNRELDWPIVDEELHRFVNDQQSEVGIYLYGRGLYEVMTYWETADKNLSSPEFEIEFAHIWQRMPKIVFSKTLEQVQGNARLVRDDLAAEITKLKQQPGKDIDIGGATIASSLIQLGLIDEYQLFIQPIVLGGGTPFFPALDGKINLRLVETRTFGSGVVYVRYQRADESQSDE